MAYSTQMAYKRCEISAEEFLRKIDIYGNLESYEAKKGVEFLLLILYGVSVLEEASILSR